MAKVFKPLIWLTFLALFGCQTSGFLAGRNGDGPVPPAALVDRNAEGVGDEKSSATDNVLVKTPLVTAVGDTFNQVDFARAERAQVTALGRKRGGVPVAWFNPKTGQRGEVVAGPIYTINGRQCRDYIHIVTLDGTQQDVRGVACLEAEGQWTDIS